LSYQTYAVAAGINKDGKGDATGAFIPGAQKFSRINGGSYKVFENGGNGKKNFLDAVSAGLSCLDFFAYFGHGWESTTDFIHGQLGSAGIISDTDLDEFAAILKTKITDTATIALYACWAGKENGLTTRLQRKLGGNVWIYGHTCAGHSFMNPAVSEVNTMAYRKMYPYGDDLYSAWAEALQYTDLWARFPMLIDSDIARELYAIRLSGKWRVGAGSTSKTYQFEWKPSTGTYDESNIAIWPSGAVTQVGTKNRGTWAIDDVMQVFWEDGTEETWELPLNAKLEKIKIGTQSATAVRTSHAQVGSMQG
jgi:hypothetical protein